jgi:hypothetical protein
MKNPLQFLPTIIPALTILFSSSPLPASDYGYLLAEDQRCIEDYEYFILLDKAVKNAGPEKRALAEKAKALLNFPESLFKSGTEYTKDPKALLEYRQKIARLLEDFQ